MRKSNATRSTGINRWKSRTTKSTSYGTSGKWGKAFHSASGTSTPKTYGTKVVAGFKSTGAARGYNQVCNTFETRSKAYKMLWEQTRGTCKGSRPSPATLKSFANWVNKGANIFKVTNAQIKKWCHTNQTFKTCASAKTVLGNKFGKTTIKAITNNKTGGFLVATASTLRGKPFKFPC